MRAENQTSVSFDEDIFSFGKKKYVPLLDLNPPLEKWLRLYLDEAARLQSKHFRRTQLVRNRMDVIKEQLKLKEFLWCSTMGLNLQTGVIAGFHRTVERHLAELGHLEGTKVIFSDLHHTTLAADREARHTICLAVLDQAEDWARFLRRYDQTDLQYLIKDTDYKEYELRRLLGGIQILRPLAIGAVGGSQIARPIEILLYKERIAVLLHHLYMLSEVLDEHSMTQFELEIDIAQWETGVIFPSERPVIQKLLSCKFLTIF
ncbi:unnamed protein product [Oikopleura dioica]|uniref:DUF4461 domain-containing protein n=1 Tax=Oikopleura dioica TaxID=34765 RepID=E4WSA9_OIKDI|nr:unnamed protein product [Oikopleura dioica]